MGSAAPRPAPLPLLLPLLLLLLLRAERLRGAELTFELLDSAQQCFHQEVEQGARFSLDYQVAPDPHPPTSRCRQGGGGVRGRALRPWSRTEHPLWAAGRALSEPLRSRCRPARTEGGSEAVGSGSLPPCAVVVRGAQECEKRG